MTADLEQKIQEAREAGYSDEEIQRYLQSQQTGAVPTDAAPTTTIDRGEEATALGQYGAAKALEYGAYGYGAKKALDAIRGMRTPPAAPPAGPVAPPPLPTTGTPQHTMDILRSPTGQAPSTSPSIMQQVQQFALEKLRSPAVAGMARGMGALGAMLYSPGLNAGEDEQLRRMRAQQEEMLRRGQMR